MGKAFSQMDQGGDTSTAMVSLWIVAYCKLLVGTAATVASCVMYVWCWLALRLVVSLRLLSAAEGGGMAKGAASTLALDAGCVVTGLWPSSLLYSSCRLA